MRFEPILIAMLLSGCAAPTVSETLDKGDIIRIPTLPSPVVLDKVIREDEWAGAWLLRSEFVIDDGSSVSGRYPFVLRLGADEERLFAAIEIANVTQRFERVEEGLASPAESIWLYLAEDEDQLGGRTDGLVVNHHHYNGTSSLDQYWNGGSWAIQRTKKVGSFNEGSPTGGRWARGTQTDTMDVEWVIYRRTSFPEYDLPLEGPTVFRLAVGLGLPSSIEARDGAPDDMHSTVVGAGGSPVTSRDPTGWIRLLLEP